ncbi:MAG: hypothetical protein ACLP0L_14200 [Solirubrobacteraceae bacterium]
MSCVRSSRRSNELAPEFPADPFAVMRSLPLADRPVFYVPAIDYYVELTFDPNVSFRGPQTLWVTARLT